MLKSPVSARVLRWEPWWVWLLFAAAFAAVPLSLGEIGLSWDALNHHIYLGWIAEQPRFDRDLLAARTQAYQYPYLYWPVYRLAMAGVSGATAGVVLALLQALAVPPVWILARACVPGATWQDLLLRGCAVLLAFLSGLTLSLLDSTANDMLGAIPFLWSMALAILATEKPGQARRFLVASGLLAGVSVAFKLSNGPLALVLPWLWCQHAGAWREGLRRIVLAGLMALLSFALVYGPWGWQMWEVTGNPVYPLYDDLFEPVRAALGWRP